VPASVARLGVQWERVPRGWCLRALSGTLHATPVPGERPAMFARLSRSWSLVKASADVLRSDKELLLFPLVSSIVALLVAATFILPVFGMGLLKDWVGEGGLDVAAYLFLFCFYLAQYFVIFFFNSALVGAALIRLEGGDPTVRDGLRIAWSRKGAILGYAAIAATVGMVLRAIEERVGVIGRIIVGLLGTAWTVATFLTVPVLVAQNVGPVDAVKQSVAMLRRTWGENLIGQGGLGLAFGLMTFVVLLAGLGLTLAMFAIKAPWLGAGMIGTTVLALLLLGLIQAALSGIYSAALYRYAIAGDTPGGFDAGTLQNAFAPKS